MNIYVTELIGTSVFQHGVCVGRVQAIFFGAHTNSIAGVRISPRIFYPASVLSIQAGVFILLEKKHAPQKGKNWISLRVLSTKKEDLGWVKDILVNEETLTVESIVVVKKILGFSFAPRIFPVSRLLEVRKKNLVIDDDNKISTQKPILRPAF